MCSTYNVFLVDVCAGCNQYSYRFDASSFAGYVEGCDFMRINLIQAIHFCANREERFHHFNLSLFTGYLQWGRGSIIVRRSQLPINIGTSGDPHLDDINMAISSSAEERHVAGIHMSSVYLSARFMGALISALTTVA